MLLSVHVCDRIDKVRAFNDAVLIHSVVLLIRHGYSAQLPSLGGYDLKVVYSYGPVFVLVLVYIAGNINAVAMIDEQGAKGGAPSLGKMTLVLATYAVLRHGSVCRFVEWYECSPLPWFS
jgi:hypothetical protein